MSPVQRFVYDKIVMGAVMPALGQAHPVGVGAQRHVDALFDDRYRDGTLYGSRAGKLSGPLVDQAQIFPDLADPAYQDNAYAAVHRFIS